MTVPSEFVFRKFGANSAVSTTFVPVAEGGVYRTPQVGGAAQLRVRAGNADDTAAGDGARKVTLSGLNAAGEYIEEEIETNGASAGALSSNAFLRLFRGYVSESGTYADQDSGSHVADIVIETAGGVDWMTITSTNFPHGQSLIGAYSVPLGYVARIRDIVLCVDSTKSATLALFRRGNILDTAAPYSAMRVQATFRGVSGVRAIKPQEYNDEDNETFAEYDQLTDFGFMARVAVTSAAVSVDFGVQLINRLAIEKYRV